MINNCKQTFIMVVMTIIMIVRDYMSTNLHEEKVSVVTLHVQTTKEMKKRGRKGSWCWQT